MTTIDESETFFWERQSHKELVTDVREAPELSSDVESDLEMSETRVRIQRVDEETRVDSRTSSSSAWLNSELKDRRSRERHWRMRHDRLTVSGLGDHRLSTPDM